MRIGWKADGGRHHDVDAGAFHDRRVDQGDRKRKGGLREELEDRRAAAAGLKSLD